MVWTGTFLNSTAELFRGVEGYFAVLGSGIINTPIVTPTQVNLTSANFLGRIIFTGNNLTVGSTTVTNGITIPVFTGGTITGIEYLYNYRLGEAIDAGIQDTTPLIQPSFLEPSAVLTLPNISASALSDAVVQSYSTPTPTPLRAFFSQDSHVYTGTDGVNLIASYDGNDTLIGLGGNDFLQGDGGDDFLDGGDGTDGLEGGNGNDFFLPGSSNFTNAVPVGDAVSDNGTNPNEIDTVSYENAPSAVGIDLNGGQGAGWAQGLSAAGIEAFIGSDFNDTLIGSTFASEILIGGNGDDTLVGLDGSDTLQGGAGFDELRGGSDSTFGLAGSGDVARFAANSNQLEVFFFNDGSIFVAAPGGGVDRLFGIELIQTNDGIFGINQFTRSSRQLSFGDDEVNSLAGTAGADLIFGRGGSDTLVGAGGGDNLNGGNGADLLQGGLGSDTLLGEADSDTFAGSLAELDGDVIADFTTDDVLLVQNASFTQDSLTITQGSAVLDIDANSDGTVDSRITLQGDFSSADFLVEPVASGNSSATSITILSEFDRGNQFSTPFFRFRNTQLGNNSTYIYVGEEEKNSILNDPNFSQTFELEGRASGEDVPAFIARETPGDDVVPVNRYRNTNTDTGTYLFSTEEDFQQDTRIQQDNFENEGIAFYAYPPNSGSGSNFTRFENSGLPDTFVFQGSAEAANTRENFDGFIDQGETWAVETL